jgi:hypothetical protein
VSAAVYTADEVAELFNVSEWAIYQAVRRGERGDDAGPIGRLAIHVGRRIVWPKAPIDRLLGLECDA